VQQERFAWIWDTALVIILGIYFAYVSVVHMTEVGPSIAMRIEVLALTTLVALVSVGLAHFIYTSSRQLLKKSAMRNALMAAVLLSACWPLGASAQDEALIVDLGARSSEQTYPIRLTAQNLNCEQPQDFRFDLSRTPWLRLEGDGVVRQLGPGQSGSLIATLDPAGLSPGPHQGVVRVICDTCAVLFTNCHISVQELVLQMRVTPPPAQTTAPPAPPVPPVPPVIVRPPVPSPVIDEPDSEDETESEAPPQNCTCATSAVITQDFAGDVRVYNSRNGRTRSAFLGMQVNELYRVETGPDSHAVIRTSEGEEIYVGPDSVFTMPLCPGSQAPLILIAKNVVGIVTVQRPGSTHWRRLREGMVVQEGWRIQTGLNSRVVLTDPDLGIEVYISPTSQITVSEVLIPADDPNADDTHIDIRFGGVTVNTARTTRRTDMRVAQCTGNSTPAG